MDSIQWNWKNGFCRKHAGQGAPCPVCISTLDGDLVREKEIEGAKEAFLAGMEWAGLLTRAEATALDLWREARRSATEQEIRNPSMTGKPEAVVRMAMFPKSDPTVLMGGDFKGFETKVVDRALTPRSVELTIPDDGEIYEKLALKRLVVDPSLGKAGSIQSQIMEKALEGHLELFRSLREYHALEATERNSIAFWRDVYKTVLLSPDAHRVSADEWIASEDTAYKGISLLANSIVARAAAYYPKIAMDVLVRAAFFFERKRELSVQTYLLIGAAAEEAAMFIRGSLSLYADRARFKDGFVEYEGLRSISYSLVTKELCIEFDVETMLDKVNRSKPCDVRDYLPMRMSGVFEKYRSYRSNPPIQSMGADLTRRVTESISGETLAILNENVKVGEQWAHQELPPQKGTVIRKPITEDEWLGLEDRAFAALLDGDRRMIKAFLEDHPKVTASFLARVIFCSNHDRPITSLVSKDWSPEQEAAYNALMSRG